MKQLSLILACFLAALSVGVGLAQSPERIELRLQVRWIDGVPAEGQRIGLVRMSDGAPVGERVTDANGNAVWQVSVGDIYQFETPYRYSDLAQDAMGDNGVNDLSVYTGWLGEVTEHMDAPPPIEFRIVLANESTNGRGNFAFMDRAVGDELPDPDIPGVTSPVDHHAESSAEEQEQTLVFVDTPEDAATLVAAQGTPAPDGAQESVTGSAWLLVIGVFAVLVVAGLIWLWPALSGGMR